MRRLGADCFVVAMKRGNAHGAMGSADAGDDRGGRVGPGNFHHELLTEPYVKSIMRQLDCRSVIGGKPNCSGNRVAASGRLVWRID